MATQKVKIKPIDIPRVRHMSGSEIKALRESLNLRQGTMAKVMGMAAITISKWERNEVVPNAGAMRLLNLLEENGLDFIL